MFTFLKNRKGSIALPFLAILALFTITTLYFIEDYTRKQAVIKQATDAYLVETLAEKHQQDALDMENNTSQTFTYTIGSVVLEKSKHGTYAKMNIELETGFKRQVFVNIQ